MRNFRPTAVASALVVATAIAAVPAQAQNASKADDKAAEAPAKATLTQDQINRRVDEIFASETLKKQAIAQAKKKGYEVEKLNDEQLRAAVAEYLKKDYEQNPGSWELQAAKQALTPEEADQNVVEGKVKTGTGAGGSSDVIFKGSSQSGDDRLSGGKDATLGEIITAGGSSKAGSLVEGDRAVNAVDMFGKTTRVEALPQWARLWIDAFTIAGIGSLVGLILSLIHI